MQVESFNAGDFVELLSGGPTMTVVSPIVSALADKPRVILCGWFNRGVYKEQEFSPQVLKKVETAKPYEDTIKQPKPKK